jgi:hypothetical protein
MVFLANSQSQRSDYTSAQLFIGIKAKDKQLGGFPHPPRMLRVDGSARYGVTVSI